jgi:hypothetical protein
MTPTWLLILPSDALPQAGQRGGGQAAAGGACSDLNIMLDPPPEWQLLPLSWLDQHRAAEARALGVGSVRAPLRYCHHRRRRPSQRHRRQPLQFDCECVEPQFWSYRKAEMHVCGREDFGPGRDLAGQGPERGEQDATQASFWETTRVQHAGGCLHNNRYI